MGRPAAEPTVAEFLIEFHDRAGVVHEPRVPRADRRRCLLRQGRGAGEHLLTRDRPDQTLPDRGDRVPIVAARCLADVWVLERREHLATLRIVAIHKLDKTLGTD